MINLSLLSKTIYVGLDNKLKTITEAVLLANKNDTILVKNGVYKESKIYIKKPIHVVGQDFPIIDGENKFENLFIVEADGSSISGLRFTNVALSYTKEVAGIFVSSCNNFTLKDNYFENVFYGLIIQDSNYGVIQNNKIIGQALDEVSSGNGIHIWKSSNIRVENNEIKSMRDGIYLEFVGRSFVSNNYCEDNIRYGLHFMFSDNNEYYQNEFKNNGAGVAVMFSKFIKIYDNIFHFNWGSSSYGLLLKEINDLEIRDNFFQQNTIGLKIDGCNRVTYSHNSFIGNGWAIRFTGGCYDNLFEYNSFINNAFDVSYNSSLNNNLFQTNYWSEYNGYDLNKDGIGDVPYRPVKLFSYIVNKVPEALVLLRSLFIDVVNFSENVSPVFTPENLMDRKPLMSSIK